MLFGRLQHSLLGPPIPEGTVQGPRAVSRIRIQEVDRIEEYCLFYVPVYSKSRKCLGNKPWKKREKSTIFLSILSIAPAILALQGWEYHKWTSYVERSRVVYGKYEE